MTLLGGLLSQLGSARQMQSIDVRVQDKLDTALEKSQAIDKAPRRDPLMDALRGSLGGSMYA